MFAQISLSWLVALALCSFAQPLHAAESSTAELSQKLGIGEVVHRVDRPPLADLALRDGGVLVVDLEGASGPKVIRRIADGERIDQLMLRGDALFLLKTVHEAEVYDLRDPREPSTSSPRSTFAPSLSPSRSARSPSASRCEVAILTTPSRSQRPAPIRPMTSRSASAAAL